MLELFAQGIASALNAHMFRVHSVQNVIDPKAWPTLAVSMCDIRRGHVLIS